MKKQGISVVAALGLATTLGMGQAMARDAETKFDDMDANADGRVSQAEHAAWASQKFARMDANGDGRVTATEMNAQKERMGSSKADSKAEMSSEEKIRMIDTNADGVLTKDEHEAGTATKFREMDTNRDGFLSKNEVRAGHGKMMKPRASDTTRSTDTQRSTDTPAPTPRSTDTLRPSDLPSTDDTSAPRITQ